MKTTEQNPEEAYSSPAQYTSSPVTITAHRYREENVAALASWMGTQNVRYRPRIHLTQIWVAANEAWLPLEDGEWVIQDELGFYPCKDVVFRKKYHKALQRDAQLKTLVISDDRYAGYTFASTSEESWLEKDGRRDEAATKRFNEEIAGYDKVEWRG